LKASVSGFLRSLASAFEASNAQYIPRAPTPLLNSTANKKSVSPQWHAIGKPLPTWPLDIFGLDDLEVNIHPASLQHPAHWHRAKAQNFLGDV